MDFAQIEALWIANGGAPEWAPLMAGTAIEESSGNSTAINNDASTGDYSVGLWEINYFGDLYASRAQQFGTPTALANDPNAQAKAAISIAGPNMAGYVQAWGPRDAVGRAWAAAGYPQGPSSATVQGWLNAAGSGEGTASATPAAPGSSSGSSGDKNCLLSSPSFLGIGGGCLFTASQWKGFRGGLLLVAGSVLMLPGMLIITAFAFERTPIGSQAKQLVGMFPEGAVANKVINTGGSVGSSSAKPPGTIPVSQLPTRGAGESAASYGARIPKAPL